MASSPHAVALAKRAVPAALVGVVSAVLLVVLSVLAERLQDVIWDDLPDALDVDGGSRWWIFGTLTVVGVVIGLAVWLLPGHAGPDPATQSMVAPPLAAAVLPGLALVTVIGLAGGVSLGPENPVIAINVGVAVWLGSTFAKGPAAREWMSYAAAGTIGAMFATPVAAALVLGESPAPPGAPPLWDRLFAPLVAAASGSLTMFAFGQPVLSVAVAPYPGIEWWHVIAAPAVAAAAALIGVVAVYAFPVVHAAFHRIGSVALRIAVGGVLLGAIGAVGGKISLFKGLDEMKTLVGEHDSTGRLVVILVAKLLALIVAAAAGFRGGRVFPAVFCGVAVGLIAHQLVDRVPISLAISAGVLGLVLAVSRSGWISLFLAITTVGDISILPVVCIALLPAWLLVTDRPPMEIPVPEPTTPQVAPA